MKKLFFFLLVLYLMGSTCFAQKSEEQCFKENYKANYLEHGILPEFLEEFIENRVNINEYNKYTKLGIDLKQASYAGGRDFEKSALTTPVIVIGKVVDVMAHPLRKRYYHSTYTLEVDKILLNDTPYPITLKEPIYFKQMSGPMYDINGKKALLQVSIDQVFVIGKEYLFFLTPILPTIEERKSKNDPNTLEFDNITISDYDPRDSYEIVKNKIKIDSKEIKISRIIKLIKQLNNIKFKK